MDQLSPQHVPVYETSDERDQLWRRCIERDVPVLAIRNARRGYIVRYDLQHLDAELGTDAVRTVRSVTRSWRSYPTGTDPLSQAECVGGELGPVSGDLHTDSETGARDLASRLSAIVFEQDHWQ